MDATVVIALAALVLSALTFVAMQFGGRRAASATYVAELERRIEKLESELAAKTNRVSELEELNFKLTQRLFRNGGSH